MESGFPSQSEDKASVCPWRDLGMKAPENKEMILDISMFSGKQHHNASHEHLGRTLHGEVKENFPRDKHGGTFC